MSKPRLLILASGDKEKERGGSGAEQLVLASRNGILDADIVGIGSNHADGGVRTRAKKLGVKFFYFPGPFIASQYQWIARSFRADFVALSGWLKLVVGLDPTKTFNIHPGDLPYYGGYGMHGPYIHQRTMADYRKGFITHTAVCMHFVSKTEEGDRSQYDTGPVFFRHWVKIEPNDTPVSLAQRVNKVEHAHQARVTNMVVNGLITWDGVSSTTLRYPEGYSINQGDLD